MSETANSTKIITSSNWEIDNNKNFSDCISLVSLAESPESTNLEDVVSLETCLALKSAHTGEPCKLDFKVDDKQKIARIALVSEALVLEFFKQSGEYATTVFAEFVDEFQDHAVYFAEAKIEPPSTEASIKFTRTKSKGTSMWIYGIKLILTEAVESLNGAFNLDVISSYFDGTDQQMPDKIGLAKKFLESYSSEYSSDEDLNSSFQKLALNFNLQKFKNNSKDLIHLNGKQENNKCESSTSQDLSDLKTYIDDKLSTLEKRLLERIELMEKQTTLKLDAIFKKLELNN